MNRSKALWLSVAAIAVLNLSIMPVAMATDVHEPEADPDFRGLRTGTDDYYIKTWYIFNDSRLDGVLDPGDTHVATFENWWSPVSAHTEHNYSEGPYGPNMYEYDPNTDDMPSGPMNFATNKFNYSSDPNGDNNAGYNYWLPMEANTMSFYMNYSQFDNNNFSDPNDTSFPQYVADSTDPNYSEMVQLRNEDRNGWSLGWVTNYVEKDINGNVINDQTPEGTVTMDIYVHNGQGTYTTQFQDPNDPNSTVTGTSNSNPNVSMSNDISPLALDHTQYHPPTFDPNTLTYNSLSEANQLYMDELGLSQTEFNAIVASLGANVSEWDPNDIQNQINVIWANRTPSDIASNSNFDDPNGNPYTYDDAFTDRGTYVKSTSDGGVIAGLAGQTNYDPNENNWWDQQVVRIDLAEEVFKIGNDPNYGNITKITFWDFGYDDPNSAGQITPVAIEFFIDLTRTVEEGQLYYKVDPSDPSTWIYFPENRIYIAQVSTIPEPTTMALLGGGGVLVLLRRRHRRRAAKKKTDRLRL